MIRYDKVEVREKLTIEQIFELLTEWGGEPVYSPTGLIASTICHNSPGVGSKKLYYYSSNQMFHCYTGCEKSTFDIFELFIKISAIQYEQEIDFDKAVRYIANKFQLFSYVENTELDTELKDEEIFANYDRIQQITLPPKKEIILKEYDSKILDHLNYNVKLRPWLQDGISQEVIDQARIGFYPKDLQITIPHYDVNGRFIGLRGRCIAKEDAERFGKYRPVFINRQWYNHPLGVNLYNLNKSKKNIAKFEKAIVFEGEKSPLQYQTIYGMDRDITVASCGNNLSQYQVDLLVEAGAKEIILAYDRQFKEYNSDEYNKWKKHLIALHQRYKYDALITIIFDKNMITNYKSSPIDEGQEKFETLFKERIVL